MKLRSMLLFALVVSAAAQRPETCYVESTGSGKYIGSTDMYLSAIIRFSSDRSHRYEVLCDTKNSTCKQLAAGSTYYIVNLSPSDPDAYSGSLTSRIMSENDSAVYYLNGPG